jgi:hypothetical protein
MGGLSCNCAVGKGAEGKRGGLVRKSPGRSAGWVCRWEIVSFALSVSLRPPSPPSLSQSLSVSLPESVTVSYSLSEFVFRAFRLLYAVFISVSDSSLSLFCSLTNSLSLTETLSILGGPVGPLASRRRGTCCAAGCAAKCALVRCQPT